MPIKVFDHIIGLEIMPVKTRIRMMKAGDARQVAEIHFREIGGFLPSLGLDFLTAFYENCHLLSGVFVIVAETDGMVSGFASCALEVNNLWSKVLRLSPFRFAKSIARAILRNPGIIIELLGTLLYPGFSKSGSELLSIAVRKKYSRQGIGGQLFREVAAEFFKRKSNIFRISIYEGNSAEYFYLKMGCVLSDSFKFLGKTMNYYSYRKSGNKIRLTLLDYDSLYANQVFLPLFDMEKIEIAAVIVSDCILYKKSRLEALHFLLKRQGFKYFLFKVFDQLMYSVTSVLTRERIITKAKKMDIPVFRIRDINGPESLVLLEKLKAHYLISYFNQVLKKETLKTALTGSINIHPGYLPMYRGVASSLWAMKNSEGFGGVTVHYMSETLDTGDILARAKVPTRGISLHMHNYLCCKSGGLLLSGILGDFTKGRKVPAVKQTEGIYYSWPESRDVEEFLRKGNSLVKPDDLKLYFS